MKRPKLKSLFKWFGIVILTPIVLFLLLAIALYLPPVQAFVKDKVTKRLSAETGMTITIERVKLAFPLDLAIDKVLALERGDTLLATDALRLNIKLWPLLKQQVDISGFELWRAQVDTKSYISDTHIKGRLEMLKLTKPANIDLKKQFVDLNRINLANANIQVFLSDTAQQDTTTSNPTKWKIKIGSVHVDKTHFFVRMPGDSLRIGGYLAKAKVEKGFFNLEDADYRARKITIHQSELNYDVPQAVQTKGFDTNHIHLTSLNLQVDTLHYHNGALSVGIPLISTKDQSGLEIRELKGRVSLDSTHINMPVFNLKTPNSDIEATANLAWKALSPGSNEQMRVTLKGHVGRPDVMALAGNVAKEIAPYYPEAALQLSGNAEGNSDHLKINYLTATLPSFLHFDAKGHIGKITDEKRRFGNVDYSLKTGNLSYYKKVLPTSLKQRLEIPRNMLLAGKINFTGDKYGTHSTLRVGKGRLAIQGSYDISAENYQAKLLASQFPLYAFLPQDSLSALTATIEAKGRGLDFMKKGTHTIAKADIQIFSYNKIPLDSIQLDATLNGGHAVAHLLANNRMIAANTNITADILDKEIQASVNGSLEDLNLLYLTDGKDSTHVMAGLDMKGKILTNGNEFATEGELKYINIITPTMGYPADNVRFGFAAAQDSTRGYIESGDLEARLHSNKPVGEIADQLVAFSEQIAQQIKNAHFDQKLLMSYLPNMDLYVRSGKSNPVIQFLHFEGYDLDSLYLNMTANQKNGINGDLLLLAFKTGDLLLDRTTAHIYQDSTGLKLESNIENTSKRNPNRFTASVGGEMLTDGFSLKALFNDEKGIKGLDIGVNAQLSPNGSMTLHLFPEESTIAFRKFKVNKNNYFTYSPGNYFSANVDLLADDRTGLKITTPEGDSLRDVTVSLSHINLQELTSVFPFLPNLGGFLGGDIHAQWEGDNLTAAGQIELEDFQYEECPLGNLSADVAYLPNDSNRHYISANISTNDQDVISVAGNYIDKGEGSLDMQVDLLEMPAKLLNGFLASDGMIGLDGNINGNLKVTGPVSAFLINGMLEPDSLRIISPLYGINLRVEDQPIEIKESRLTMANNALYSISENPLRVSGNVDFSNLDNILLNLAFKANNFEVVNSQKTKETLVYGKVFTDIDATLRGNTNFMMFRGTLKILDKTNVTYVMKDSPLTVEDQLSGLVEFTDFSDTIQVVEEKAVPPGGMFMGLDIRISNAAQLHCDLSEDGNSYFDCKGGGNLTMKYFPNGDLSLLGRFTMSQGEMKYALPFIPLKTFELQGDNNYINFTGNPMNPTLHITAMETNRASVTEEGSSTTRMVTFNVGVAITQTLNNMGLQFLIEAPEDLNVQNQLATMSTEDRGKVAVTMLATGMYLNSSNKSSFKANNALNAFLQNEIQNIAGDALKTIDLTVGVEGSTSASGNAQTDYSFQFAKHLWNDRVTFKIGGKVTAGSEAASENQSFIDNVSLEYRLGNGTSRNLRLFYDHDTVDPLEGNYSSAGVGLVLRKKTNTFGEIFLFRPSKKKENKEQLP